MKSGLNGEKSDVVLGLHLGKISLVFTQTCPFPTVHLFTFDSLLPLSPDALFLRDVLDLVKIPRYLKIITNWLFQEIITINVGINYQTR